MKNQKINIVGKKLVGPDKKLQGTILHQFTEVGFCDQHRDCLGPIIRFRWVDGRVRRECLAVLIKQNGYKLTE